MAFKIHTIIWRLESHERLPKKSFDSMARPEDWESAACGAFDLQALIDTYNQGFYNQSNTNYEKLNIRMHGQHSSRTMRFSLKPCDAL